MWHSQYHLKKRLFPHEDSICVWLQIIIIKSPDHIAQSVTYLASDVCLTVDPGVASSIPTRSHTFVEIDHEFLWSFSSRPLNLRLYMQVVVKLLLLF